MYDLTDKLLPGASPELQHAVGRLLAIGAFKIADIQTARDVVRVMNTDESVCGRDQIYCVVLALMLAYYRADTRLRLDVCPAADNNDAFHKEDSPEGNFETLLRRIIPDVYTEDGFSADASVRYLNGVWNSLRSHNYKDLRTACAAENSPLVFYEEKEKHYVYFQRFFRIETELSERISRLVKKSPQPTENLDQIVSEATSFRGFTLTPEQKKAVRLSIEKFGIIVTGGPGTGKTTVVCAICRAFLRIGIKRSRIALAAPTGRAAMRLAEAVNTEMTDGVGAPGGKLDNKEKFAGQTIHGLLGVSRGKFVYGGKIKVPYDAVIVDEASMIDLGLMDSLLSALNENCRLVLVGDSRQLPSVETGFVLGGMLEDKVWMDNTVRLDASHRNRGNLLRTSQAIDAGNFENTLMTDFCIPPDGKNIPWYETPENSCFRVRGVNTSDPSGLKLCVRSWNREFVAEMKKTCRLSIKNNKDKLSVILTKITNSIILTPLREGFFGAAGINDFITDGRASGIRTSRGLNLLYPGLPIILNRSDRKTTLKNGDLGVIVNNTDDSKFYAVFYPDGLVVPIADVPDFSVAYAITIHKSQGSQFNNVMMVLTPDVGNPLLMRPLFYTGITRAKKRAFVFATDAALKRTVENNPHREYGALSHGI